MVMVIKRWKGSTRKFNECSLEKIEKVDKEDGKSISIKNEKSNHIFHLREVGGLCKIYVQNC